MEIKQYRDLVPGDYVRGVAGDFERVTRSDFYNVCQDLCLGKRLDMSVESVEVERRPGYSNHVRVHGYQASTDTVETFQAYEVHGASNA